METNFRNSYERVLELSELKFHILTVERLAAVKSEEEYFKGISRQRAGTAVARALPLKVNYAM